MMFCKFCGKEIEDNSKFCQYCGKNLEEKQDNNNQNEQSNIKDNAYNSNFEEKSHIGCLIPFAILIIFIFILILTQSKPFEEDTIAQESLARVLCQQEVQSKLRNPKSAEFAKGSETKIEQLENMKYNVYSYVYAQNGFGATVKNDYACYVELTSENMGIVKKLEMR